jgi:hypothetical protein
MEQLAAYAAPFATTVAALIVASNLGSRVTGAGFIVFTIGSIAWAALGYATDQPNLLWQNIVLTLLNLFGVWRWLGWQRRIEDGAQSAAEASKVTASENLFPVSTLAKATVRSVEGEELGRSVDAMAGCNSGRLSYLVVAEGGVAGVGESLRRLPWSGCRVEEETVTTPVSKARFCSLETLEPDHWPAR